MTITQPSYQVGKDCTTLLTARAITTSSLALASLLIVMMRVDANKRMTDERSKSILLHSWHHVAAKQMLKSLLELLLS